MILPSNIKEGEAYIRGCYITKNDGSGYSQNVVGQIIRVDIFEAIDRPTLVIDLTIEDGVGIYEDMPITGEEQIDISMVDGTGADFRHIFTVSEIKNVKSNQEGTKIVFQMRGYSVHAFQNAAIKITKSYLEPIESIVRSVLTNELGLQSNIEITPTIGPQKVVCPGWRPFQLIEWLKYRAVSGRDDGSLFTFFEGLNGTVYFKTFEDLILNPLGYKQYAQPRSGQIDPLESKQNYLINYSIPQRSNTYQQLKSGAFGVSITGFDFYTKQFVRETSTVADANFVSTNPNLAGSGLDAGGIKKAAFGLRAAGQQTKSAIIPIDLAPDSPSSFQVKALTKKLQYKATLQGVAKFQVNGDFGQGVGCGLGVYLNKRADIKEKNSMPRTSIDRMNYLVLRARHSIIRKDEKFEFTQAFECLLTGTGR